MLETRKIVVFLLAISYYLTAIATPYTVHQSYTNDSSNLTQEVFANIAILSHTATETFNSIQLTLAKSSPIDGYTFSNTKIDFSNKIVYSKESRLKIAQLLHKFTRIQLYPFFTFW